MRLGVEAALVDGTLVPGDLELIDGVVGDVALGKAGAGIAVPGFVDLQVNGFAGVDFSVADAAGYERAGQALLETGVTAFQPTFITASEEELVAALHEVPTATDTGPRILGVHLVGPFVSADALGVHPAADRRDPDPALLERLLAAGPVAQMTLAPELPGALELIDVLHERGVVVSLGHSNATAPEAHAAFDRGARTVTHLFNAMRPFGHRDPGIAGAALARDDVVVQLILDGHHLADEAAQVAWRCAQGRVALVTDAIAAAGIGDGDYRLGSVDIEVRDGVARRADGVLGGSVLTMLDAVRNLHALGAELSLAVGAGSAVPARVAGRRLGCLQPGAPADVLILDDRLELRAVFVGGKERVAV
jgi:N-acetylglucosamine-6-phosphate deacetylase